jgi:hypothetical protein
MRRRPEGLYLQIPDKGIVCHRGHSSRGQSFGLITNQNSERLLREGAATLFHVLGMWKFAAMWGVTRLSTDLRVGSTFLLLGPLSLLEPLLLLKPLSMPQSSSSMRCAPHIFPGMIVVESSNPAVAAFTKLLLLSLIVHFFSAKRRLYLWYSHARSRSAQIE